MTVTIPSGELLSPDTPHGIPDVIEAVCTAPGVGLLQQVTVNGRPVTLPCHWRPYGAVMHMALAVGLGWSPVLGATMGWDHAAGDGPLAQGLEIGIASAALSHGVTEALTREAARVLGGLVDGCDERTIGATLRQGLECMQALEAHGGAGTLVGDRHVRLLEHIL